MPTEKPGKTIGKGMIAAAWVLLLLGLSVAFSQWEARQYNPNNNLNAMGSSEVVLERNRFNHYVATGLINNEPVVFLLDTGATAVAVPANLAKRLGLEAGSAQYARTANGVVQVYDTQIDTLQLGSIRLRDVRASINPGMNGSEVLLGMSALKHLEFTQSGSTLTLRLR